MNRTHPMITVMAMLTVAFLYLPLVSVAVFSLLVLRLESR